MPLAICVVCLPIDLAHSLGADHKFVFGDKIKEKSSNALTDSKKIKSNFLLLKIQKYNGTTNCFTA